MSISSHDGGTGRILRVKTGFNPNSSSISSDIISFFTAAAGVTSLFAVATAVVMARFKDDKEKKPDAPAPHSDQ
jgi:hypothetical protein